MMSRGSNDLPFTVTMPFPMARFIWDRGKSVALAMNLSKRWVELMGSFSETVFPAGNCGTGSLAIAPQCTFVAPGTGG